MELNFMDELCGSPFWDTNLTWNAADAPGFTDCFKHTALTWIPCFYLYLFFPLECYSLKKSKAKDIPFNKYNITKLIFIILTIIQNVAEIFNFKIYNAVRPSVYIYSSILKCSSSVLFLTLTVANIKRGIRSSGVLFWYSFVLMICNILPQMRIIILGNDGVFVGELLHEVLDCFLSIMILVLNCFADSRPKYESTHGGENYCPSHNASQVSKLFFLWFDVILWRNYRKVATSILWTIDPEESISHLLPKFEKYSSTFDTNTRDKNNKSTIMKPILKMFWLDITISMFVKLLQMLSTLAFPLILGLFLMFMEGREPAWKGYFCSFLFLMNTIFLMIVTNLAAILMARLQFKIKSILVSTIYKKALKISSSNRKKYSTGDIINILAVDTEKITQPILFWCQMWVTPIQVALTFYFVWYILGYSALAIIGVLLALLPLIYYLHKEIKKLQIIGMEKKDKRGNFIQEILTGIKILKLYSWEACFEKEVLLRRQNELKTIKKYTDLKALTLLLFACVPLLMYLATFATYVLSSAQHVMNIRAAFVTISLLNSLALTLRMTQTGLSAWMEAMVSIDRIDQFLQSDELNLNVISRNDKVEEAIVIEKGEFSWTDDTKEPSTLTDLDIKIKQGSIVSVVGPVGSGKSSLISAILGEMNKVKGTINIKGKVAYIPQQAWILNATFKENITLGNPVKESLYQKALDACALRADLATLSDDDLTEIGEKGINLSGGQKQRISLARAICYDADIYLLDDPFSAVDFHIANHIFQEVVGPNGLLKNKTRLLVTHSTTFLSQTDSIIVLKEGNISEVGSFQSLLRDQGEFAKFLETYANDTGNEENRDVINYAKITNGQHSTTDYNNTSNHVSTNMIIDTEEERKDDNMDVRKNSINNSNTIANPSKKLIETEELRTDAVKFSVYKYYLAAVGKFFLCTSLPMYILYQISSLLSSIWLLKWSNADSSSSSTDDDHFYVKIYLILGFTEGLIMLAGNVLLLRGLLKASSYLHNTLISDVLKWPMWLLHSIPTGRIISRLIEEIFILDDFVVTWIVEFFLLVGRFLSVCLVVIYITPIGIAVIIPTCIFSYLLKGFYLPPVHQSTRLISMSNSFLYSCFVETISGLSSVRSYGYENRLISKTHKRLDHFSSTVLSYNLCIRCLNIKMEIIAGLFSCFASIFVVSARNDLDVGLMALSMSYSIQMTKEAGTLLLVLTLVERGIVSVERIKEYIEQPQEAPSYISGDNKYTAWPDKGEIIFENYGLRYREDLDLVLRNISIEMKSGEKIGIVGRTGAGKTSLILGLFRLIEPAEGKILIDGVDISTIGLHLLRSRLTLIPQDPVLFLGTIRFNLDPTGKCSDENLWNVLEKAHLKKFISSLPKGLEHDIEEGGANMSFGQKQLICLARALLRKTKILILDEATASVDVETDELIQEAIRNEFSDCTVVTIAHRLNTIIDYDRILTVDGGRVVEYDTPSNLMKSQDSTFYRMARESGLLNNAESKE